MRTHWKVSCIYNQIEVLCALLPSSDVWIPDPLHHHHRFSEEWLGIHGLSQTIVCEKLCSSCWVFRIVNRQPVEKTLEFLADDRFIHSVCRIAYASVPPDEPVGRRRYAHRKSRIQACSFDFTPVRPKVAVQCLYNPLYLRDGDFICRPRDRLPWPGLLLIIVRPSRQIPSHCIKSGRDRFLLHPFQLIIHVSCQLILFVTFICNSSCS